MLKRETYLERIRPFVGKDIVKVLTGVRRCGKSVMLDLIKQELLANGVKPDRILHLNFDSGALPFELNRMAAYSFIDAKIKSGAGKFFLFLDEVQDIPEWEKMVNAMLIDFDADIYVTGSNAKLLSSELATHIAGRYVKFEIHPFSFAEFLETHRAQRGEKPPAEVFRDYIRFGGMPFLVNLNWDERNSAQYLCDIYQTILLKDVLQRNKIRDADLLERIVRFVLANIGKTFSALSIAKYLKSEQRKMTSETVLNYIRSCEEAFLFYRVRRNDLNGKKLLSINEKYYVCDHGLREAVCHDNINNIELVLENIVHNELRRRGYTVTVGKIDEQEIDFVAEKPGDIRYIQVSSYLSGEETIKRELGSLQKLDTNYPKYLLSLDEFDRGHEGIKHLNIREFLLGAEF
jgi:predicted AAA+ superfamily ATPase